jgi:predicted RNA-binding protein YlxR (DUF448 family)
MAEVEATPPEDGLDPGGLDSGPGGRAPERTCIVTRAAQAPDRMIRFVRGPDGAVVPDLRAKLPGRGAWISARREAVATAVRKNLFQRAFKGPARADPDLPDRIVVGLREDLRQAIAMANKAGCVVAGFSKVEAAIGGQPGAVAVIHAAEASPDGCRKVAAALYRRHGEAMSRIPIINDLSEDELDMALGRDHVIHAALVAGAGAAGCLSRWRRLRSFESAAAATGEPDLARIGRIDEASR